MRTNQIRRWPRLKQKPQKKRKSLTAKIVDAFALACLGLIASGMFMMGVRKTQNTYVQSQTFIFADPRMWDPIEGVPVAPLSLDGGIDRATLRSILDDDAGRLETGR